MALDRKGDPIRLAVRQRPQPMLLAECDYAAAGPAHAQAPARGCRSPSGHEATVGGPASPATRSATVAYVSTRGR